MIPVVVNGYIERIDCSSCDWTIILEEPITAADPHRQPKIDKAMPWFSSHVCSEFRKTG